MKDGKLTRVRRRHRDRLDRLVRQVGVTFVADALGLHKFTVLWALAGCCVRRSTRDAVEDFFKVRAVKGGA